MVDTNRVPGSPARSLTTSPTIPAAIQQRLRPWIDVGEVGWPGFWTWLDSVLPLLPREAPGEPPLRPRAATAPDRIRELATQLVACAGDRARLTVRSEQYFTDNQLLARRVKALEAALRTARLRGGSSMERPDPELAEVADRYLPKR